MGFIHLLKTLNDNSKLWDYRSGILSRAEIIHTWLKTANPYANTAWIKWLRWKFWVQDLSYVE